MYAGVCTYIRSLVGGDVVVLIIYDNSRTDIQGYLLKENLEEWEFWVEKVTTHTMDYLINNKV